MNLQFDDLSDILMKEKRSHIETAMPFRLVFFIIEVAKALATRLNPNGKVSLVQITTILGLDQGACGSFGARHGNI